MERGGLLADHQKPVPAWLKSQGADVRNVTGKNGLDVDVVLVWDDVGISKADLARAPEIVKFVKAGGRLVIANPRQWGWDALVDFQTRGAAASRAFAYPNVKHYMLKGIKKKYLWRWNGIPNRVGKKYVKGAILDKGTKLLWLDKPERTVAFSLPKGRGEVLICLLEIKGRIAKSNVSYDPVAERILVNMLSK